MENGNGPQAGIGTGTMVLIGLLVLLITCCCSSIIITYNRTGNINVFNWNSGARSSDDDFLKGFSFAPGAATEDSGGGLGLLDAFGIKQNCRVGPWGSWSPCSASCGTQATKTRTRSKTVPEKNGGSCLMPLSETQTCTDLPSCEVPPLTGQYEACPPGSAIDAGACRVPGTKATESECTQIKNEAALEGFQSTGTWVGATIGASEIDCNEIYKCPSGFRDTRVNQICEKDAIPKCPNNYEWNDERKLCTFKNQ